MAKMTQERPAGTDARQPAERLVIVAVAGFVTLAAVLPQVALAPLVPYLEQSLTPERSSRAATLLLRLVAAFLWVVALAWPRIVRDAAILVEWVARLSAARFWMLTIFAATLSRAWVAATFSFYPVSDVAWYHETAVSLARGEGLRFDGELTAYRFPGYPFLLSLTYRMLGEHPELAWLWGLLSTAALLALTWVIGRRLYGETPARVTVLALALYPALALRTGAAMSDLPFVAGLTVVTAVLLRDDSHRWPWAIALGALLAGLALVRGPAIGFVLVAPAFWLLTGREPRRVLVATLLLALVLTAGLAPWALRNHRLFGHAVLSTNAGWNLLIGNYEGASGGFAAPDRRFPDIAAGLNDAEVDLALWRSTTAYIVRHPLRFVGLFPGKLFHLYALETDAVSLAFQGNEQLSSFLRYGLYGASQLSYLFVFLLFLRRASGLTRADRRPRGVQWLPWLLIAFFTVITLIFFGHDRFRLAILPFLMIEASTVLARLRDGAAVESQGQSEL